MPTAGFVETATNGFAVETGGGDDVFAAPLPAAADDAVATADRPTAPEFDALDPSLQAPTSRATQTAATNARGTERTRIIHSPGVTTGRF
jgi:hypothetical protein